MIQQKFYVDFKVEQNFLFVLQSEKNSRNYLFSECYSKAEVGTVGGEGRKGIKIILHIFS